MQQGRHVANLFVLGLTNGKRVKETLPKKESPLYADASQTHVVALVSALYPERPFLVRQSLYPFLLPTGQAIRVDAGGSG
jgi:hypothetical protein